jgi:hypothetical protein
MSKYDISSLPWDEAVSFLRKQEPQTTIEAQEMARSYVRCLGLPYDKQLLYIDGMVAAVLLTKHTNGVL